MKKTLLLFAAIIQFGVTYSQEITYQKTFEEAKAQASKTNKPLLVILTVTPMAVPDSMRRVVSYVSGFDNKNVQEYYSKKFISYKVDIRDTAANRLRSKFNATIFPCYLFLDSKGQLVYKAGGNYQIPEKYMDMAKQALNRISSGNTISGFDQLDKEGKLNTREQLHDYIALKEELGIYDNPTLIDKYVGFLTINELDDYKQVLFILKAGPLAYGKAYNLCFTNKKIVDSIYKTEPLETRKAINNRIILNTRDEAIKTKNSTLAQNTASFLRGTWSKNYAEAQRASTSEMLNYYKAVKDTMNFYRQAQYFYDGYLYVSADSAKKLQAKALEDIKMAGKKAINPQTMAPSKNGKEGRVSVTTVVASQQSGSVIANTLNTGAWDVYLLGTHNVTYLIKALVWSRRSIELQPSFSYYDTLAHIMYRLDFVDEAQLNQQKAIEMAMAQPTLPAAELENLKNELVKMKKHTL